jgi:MYXO-CTERM domain-containing protein
MKLMLVGVVVSLAGTASADFSTGFEAPAYSGSAAGTALTSGFGGGGQNGWYNPVAGSADFNVYSYAGNTIGFPANPGGGGQFIGVTGSAATPIGRAQHSVDFSAGGTWTAQWDCIGGYRGTSGTATDNLGSFSLQPSTTANYFQQIMQWGTNNTNPVQYSINYGSWGAAGGTSANIVFQSPGAAWANIPVNHWIHQSTTWSFATNQILSVSIQDITAGGPLTTVDVSGNGWFLTGGQNNGLGLPAPTDIRCFTGNTDNATGWDNVSVVPAPGVLSLLGLGGLAMARRRRS